MGATYYGCGIHSAKAEHDSWVHHCPICDAKARVRSLFAETDRLMEQAGFVSGTPVGLPSSTGLPSPPQRSEEGPKGASGQDKPTLVACDSCKGFVEPFRLQAGLSYCASCADKRHGPAQPLSLYGTPAALPDGNAIPAVCAETYGGQPRTAVSVPSVFKLPTSDADRKGLPIFDGVLMYFPLAIAEVARVSLVGNQQHNPGEPLHWAKHKSTDQRNTALRHMMDDGMGNPIDTDGTYHLAKAAWRNLAALETLLEAKQAKETK